MNIGPMNLRYFAALLIFVPNASCIAADPTNLPKIIQASPKFWETNVNPGNHKQISITFDQSMKSGQTAWQGRSSLPPEMNLETSVASPDRKTFQVDVSLQPGRVYVLALNEKVAPNVGFQNDQGTAAPPHFLVFQTSGDPAPENTPPRLTKTVPNEDSQGIDPGKLEGIELTFDKPMQKNKHGLHLFEGDKAIDLSKASFKYSSDGRTFSLSYNFKPSQDYRIELNNVSDVGFASISRVPLWPVQISFRTGLSK